MLEKPIPIHLKLIKEESISLMSILIFHISYNIGLSLFFYFIKP